MIFGQKLTWQYGPVTAKNQIISSLSKFGEKCQILSKYFTSQAGPVNRKIAGPRQYFLATGQQASAKLYTGPSPVTSKYFFAKITLKCFYVKNIVNAYDLSEMEPRPKCLILQRC